MRFHFSIAFFLTAFSGLFAQIDMDLMKGLRHRAIGPAAMSGRVTSITVAPNDLNTIYAGTASGGLWRSTSGGTNWLPIFDKGTSTQAIGCVAINPRNPDDIWVGTGEGNPRNSQNFGKGIFRSLDGGKTWKNMGLENTRSIHRVIIHRDDPNIVFAAVMGSSYGPNSDRGVFKTIDGGKTWRKVLYQNDLTGCAELAVDPQNPQKLVAAMWEYRRWPWFFKSGGKGSGLFISHDGGETWEKRTEKDGLPEGELGRMGIAISPANPKTIYALIEAKENALFKSIDGGFKWQKMATKGIGDRPFYYSEIFADPVDEHRLYTIFTTINKSEDGGKNFESFSGWNIHPDNHAFWICPNDPDYIINGNDGGLNITHDRGKTWHFAANLPVGQFYHVNVDEQTPYHIYGGLQDNGSWAGPSAVWKSGGIRNADWREVAFGDGFDVVPKKGDPRYVYAASQGGFVQYVDRETGYSTLVKPVHPDSKIELRYNWNAAMAADPFNDCGLYYASQMVHRTLDCGQTWEIISPDLTTNDTSKMHQDISGGLTFDATNAENHCTIISLAPSAFDKNTIWAATDDGQLQLTRDGGKTWQNLSKSLPNCPEKAWIPQIELSKMNAGEAFVTVNNYRQNDWRPYLFHTRDFGKTWRNLADPKVVGSYVLCAVQDAEVENLIFLGADDGLYFSLDYGSSWQKWTANDFPSTNIMDMKIQARESDLVMGTFGRAFLVIDDIKPLRELAKNSKKAFEKQMQIFRPNDGYLAFMRSVDGPRFLANADFEGENESPAAHFAVYFDSKIVRKKEEPKKEEVKKSEPKKDVKSNASSKDESSSKDDKSAPKDKDKSKKDEKATLRILDMATGDTLRTIKFKPDSGLTRVGWGLETRGVRFPSNDDPKPDADEPFGGPSVLAGDYKVVLTFQDFRDSTVVRVQNDPRVAQTDAQRTAQFEASKAFLKEIERATRAFDRLKEAEKTIKSVEDSWSAVPDSVKKDLTKSAAGLRDSILILKKRFIQQGEIKGIQRDADNLVARIFDASGRISENIGGASPNAQFLVDQTKTQISAAVEKVNRFCESDFADWRRKAEKVPFSFFKDWKKIE